VLQFPLTIKERLLGSGLAGSLKRTFHHLAGNLIFQIKRAFYADSDGSGTLEEIFPIEIRSEALPLDGLQLLQLLHPSLAFLALCVAVVLEDVALLGSGCHQRQGATRVHAACPTLQMRRPFHAEGGGSTACRAPHATPWSLVARIEETGMR